MHEDSGNLILTTASQNTESLFTIIPILTPFQNVACHIMEHISIWSKTTYWGGMCLFHLSLSLIPCNTLSSSPSKGILYQLPLSRKFPFRFRWQSLSCPSSMRCRIMPINQNHRRFVGRRIFIDSILIIHYQTDNQLTSKIS